MDVEAFRKRQEADLARYETTQPYRRLPFHERYSATAMEQPQSESAYEEDDELSDHDGEPVTDIGEKPSLAEDGDGEEAWRNSEGERLADFGVDEDADFYDEDEIPLAELIRKRRAAR